MLDLSTSRPDPAAGVGRSRTQRRGMPLAEVRMAVVHLLRDAGDHGLTKAEIVARIGNTSAPSVQRALDQLRSEDYEAKVEWFGRSRRWRLCAPLLLPFEAPDREDLLAVLIAQAILAPVADAELQARIEALVEHLDERVRSREPESRKKELPQRSSLSGTLTLGTKIDASVLRVLVAACRRKVLRIGYASPWKPVEQAKRSYEIEPWAVRVADGAVYLRAWSRDASAPRTFRVAEVTEVEETDEVCVARVPAAAEIWGEEDRAFGIDHDRGAVGVVRIRGAVARWVEHVVWHPAQVDRWIEDREVLERTIAYNSCREMARRIATVIDGVESIEPAELRDEVVGLMKKGVAALEGVGGRVDDLVGIIHRVRAGAGVQRGSSSESMPRAAEGKGEAWARPAGGERRRRRG